MSETARSSWVGRALLVARRDFKHTVLTKAFLFGIIGVPLLIIGAMAILALIMATQEQPPLEGTVAIVDRTGQLTPAVEREFELVSDAPTVEREFERVSDAPAVQMPGGAGLLGPGFGQAQAMLGRGEVRVTVERVVPEPDDDEAASRLAVEERVRSGDLLAAAIVPASLLAGPADPDGPPFVLLTTARLDADHVGLIERVVGRGIVRVRAERSSQDVEDMRRLLRAPSSSTTTLLASGGEEDQSEETRVLRQIIVPIAFMMLLWGSTFGGGQHLLSSTIEEKSNRVMEVLLSAVSPLQLMAGKIFGACLVGLLIVCVYSGVIIAGLVAAARMDLIEPIQLVYLAVYFFMAVFMVASLMAAVGSAVSDVREANSLLMPVMLILTFPLMLWFPISQDPNGMVATVFSFIPPATPFVMILRIAADEAVPAWQIVASIAWGYLCVLGMIWMASRIFRVGVLMQGKPPSPLELIRWLRYS
ncbi:MAG: ABC transporter permease [Planctomycetes bacterium]|nr:ABC transporter permease [Planctomycetota bacterium]